MELAWEKRITGGSGRRKFCFADWDRDGRLAGHSTSPTIIDWNKDKIPDLLIGAEDGFLYYLPNPKTPK